MEVRACDSFSHNFCHQDNICRIIILSDEILSYSMQRTFHAAHILEKIITLTDNKLNLTVIWVNREKKRYLANTNFLIFHAQVMLLKQWYRHHHYYHCYYEWYVNHDFHQIFLSFNVFHHFHLYPVYNVPSTVRYKTSYIGIFW